MSDRPKTQSAVSPSETGSSLVRVEDAAEPPSPVKCINPASDINSRLDTQVEVRVYPCNNSQGGGKKKFTTFTIKPEVSRSLSLLEASTFRKRYTKVFQSNYLTR